jgi:hypothetical protein
MRTPNDFNVGFVRYLHDWSTACKKPGSKQRTFIGLRTFRSADLRRVLLYASALASAVSLPVYKLWIRDPRLYVMDTETPGLHIAATFEADKDGTMERRISGTYSLTVTTGNSTVLE